MRSASPDPPPFDSSSPRLRRFGSRMLRGESNDHAPVVTSIDPLEVTLTPWSDQETLPPDWDDLAVRSAEPNAFLSSAFLEAATTAKLADRSCFLITVRNRQTTNRSLIAAGLFEDVPGSRRLPLPHLRAVNTVHTFRSGILVDKGSVNKAVFTICRAVGKQGWYGIEWPRQWLGSPVVSSLKQLCQTTRAAWNESDVFERPALSLATPFAELERRLSKSRRKTLRQNARRLDDIAPWSVHTVRGDDVAAIERFLDLEHATWKGDRGTSLRSSPSETAFFRDLMTTAAARSEAFFVELVLKTADEQPQVIASSANLTCGETVFAFKIGYDTDYARVSPGTILEWETTRHLPTWRPDLTFADSCANADSYLGKLWPDRIRLGTGLITLSRRGHWWTTARQHAQAVKRAWKAN